MGVYLEDHEPNRRQFYTGRNKPVTGCVVLHTTENGIGTPFLNVADFIQRRTTPGSYHTLSDANGWGQIGRFEWTMFSVVSHNSYTLNHSFTIRASEWDKLTFNATESVLSHGVDAIAAMNRWLISERGISIPAVRISAEEAVAGRAGFTTHAELETFNGNPGRRSDPGAGFPWDRFLETYSLVSGADSPPPAPPAVGPDKDVTALQGRLNHLGASLRVDGVFGPKTLAATEKHLGRSVTLAAVEKALRDG